MLTITEINDPGRLVDLRPEWDDLADRASPTDPFLRFEYLVPWSKYAAQGGRLRILILRDGGRLSGILPLMTRRAQRLGLGLVKTTFPARGTTPGCDLIVPEPREGVVRRAFEHLVSDGPWDVIHLAPLPADSPHIGILERLAAERRLPFLARPHRRGLYVPIEGTWQEYTRRLSRKTRKELKRLLNQLGGKGTVGFFHRGGEGVEVGPLMEDVVSVTRRSWKWDETSPGFMGFLEEFATLLAQQGWLDVSFLSVDERPLAYVFSIRFREKLFAFYSAYDEGYAPFGPGMLLMSLILEHAFETGVRGCHFGTDWSYLERWTHSFNEYTELTIFNNSVASRIFRTWLLRVKPVVDDLRRGRPTLKEARS